MKDKPYYDVSYCMYSDWGYEKRTRIWTNKKDWKNLICDRSGLCGNMKEKKHNKRVSDVHSESTRKVHKSDVSDLGGGSNRLDRYRIPPDLIYSLFLE